VISSEPSRGEDIEFKFGSTISWKLSTSGEEGDVEQGTNVSILTVWHVFFPVVNRI